MRQLLYLSLLLLACSHSQNKSGVSADMNPPHALKREKKLEMHGDKRIDNYFWLNQREDPEVIKYLEAENAYTAQTLKPTLALQEQLFQEMKSRVKEDESTYPYKDGNYNYYTRFETGKEYPIFARQKINENKEEILLNVNEMAKGHKFYQARFPHISANQEIAAFAVDTMGRRFFNIYFKNLKSGQIYKQNIENVTGNFVWAGDNDTLFYAKQDPNTLRSYAIYRYSLKADRSTLIYEEKDETFDVGVRFSLTKKFVFIVSSSTEATEWQYLAADHPLEDFKLFQKRQKYHEYSVSDGGDRFYIHTNWQGKNFRVMQTAYGKTDKKNWQEVIAHRKNTYINEVMALKDYLVISERSQALTQLRILDRKTRKGVYIDFKDSAYTVEIGMNAEFDTQWVRYEYESLKQPATTYDYDIAKKKSILRKTREVPNFNQDLYQTERVFAKAQDGTKIPMSLLYKKGLKKNGQAPALVYGYGSYGLSMDPWFSASVLSLVDRGFVYALVHIRGGSEMGRYWYDEGKLLKKKNTFTDFISCTEFLIKNKYASAKNIFAEGGSAGGLLMGAVANMRPDLYKGVVAAVPFVDVLTTMLDSSIPLTTSEYDEWGNPNEKKYYNYIKSYSPYDNVKAQDYPYMLVTTGLHDSQVQYWEPAKWVAKLRELKKDKNFVLLKTEMSAGHGGLSGRFQRLKEVALDYAFMIYVNGL